MPEGECGETETAALDCDRQIDPYPYLKLPLSTNMCSVSAVPQTPEITWGTVVHYCLCSDEVVASDCYPTYIYAFVFVAFLLYQVIACALA